MNKMQAALESMATEDAINNFQWDDLNEAFEDHRAAIRTVGELNHQLSTLGSTQVALEQMSGLTSAHRDFMVTTGLLESDVATVSTNNDERKEVALEAIERTVKYVLEQIKKFFNFILDAAKKLYKRITEGLGRIDKTARKLQAPGPNDYPVVGKASPQMVKFLSIGSGIDISKMPAADNILKDMLSAAVAIDQNLTAAIANEQFNESPDDVATKLMDTYFDKIKSKMVGGVYGNITLERSVNGISVVVKEGVSGGAEVTCESANDWNNLANVATMTKFIEDSRKESEKNLKRLRSQLEISSSANPEQADKFFNLIQKVIVFRESTVAAISNNMVSVLRYRVDLAKSLTSASKGSNPK